MTIVENHKHTFEVADIGDFDLDQDRSIIPSVQYALKSCDIDAVVDGDEMNSGVFHVYTKFSRDTIATALTKAEFFLADD